MNVIVVENGLEEGFIRKCAVMQRMRVSEIRQLALLRVYWFNIVDRFSEWLLELEMLVLQNSVLKVEPFSYCSL